MFSVPSKPGENRGERLGELESKSVKIQDAVEGFSPALNGKVTEVSDRRWDFYMFKERQKLMLQVL